CRGTLFLNLNEEMLRMAGARWDNPEPMLHLTKDNALVDWMADWLESQMTGLQTSLYLSKPGWLRYRDIRHYPQIWGWKDPRNTLTLPIWLKVVPRCQSFACCATWCGRCRIITGSKQALRARTLEGSRTVLDWKVTSPRCLNLEYGFQLWESYVEAGEQAMSAVPHANSISLTFEGWLKEPMQGLRQINEWLNLEASQSKLDDIVSRLHPDRGFAYQNSAILTAFRDEHVEKSPWLQQFYPEHHDVLS
ncbi:MAG: hypothetical protein Q9N62_00875, partial [Ghiorsea sp.]|nr:hypothetical protein [Ghiorsea sp.]